MAKDMIDNELKIGDALMFNGMIYTIKDIQENRVIGGRSATKSSISGIKIPDMITLEITLPFDAEKPFNGCVVKTPPDVSVKGNA